MDTSNFLINLGCLIGFIGLCIIIISHLKLVWETDNWSKAKWIFILSNINSLFDNRYYHYDYTFNCTILEKSTYRTKGIQWLDFHCYDYQNFNWYYGVHRTINSNNDGIVYLPSIRYLQSYTSYKGNFNQQIIKCRVERIQLSECNTKSIRCCCIMEINYTTYILCHKSWMFL